MLDENIVSKINESRAGFAKDLNSIIQHFINSKLIARNEVVNVLRELELSLDKHAIHRYEHPTDLNRLEAYILVNCELGFEQDVIMDLRTLSGVSNAKQVFSVYDIILQLNASSESEIKQISSKIRSMSNIKSILIMMCM